MDSSRQIAVAAGREKADLVLKNARYLNVFTGQFLRGDVALCGERIAGVGRYEGERELDCSGKTLVPGFLDGHIHLESSVVSPGEFARMVLPHGTAAVVTDPHEIANVLGADGVEYMLQASENLPLDVFFMLPSCVPATPFDENGAAFLHSDMEPFLERPRVLGLAELMNYEGAVAGDGEILAKLETARRAGRPIDGHAPGLSGRALNAYVGAGVGSDHECSTEAEARRKLELGQRIMIRDGTASHNLAALVPLLKDPLTAARCMLATDDKHPGELCEAGHIDAIVREAIALGAPPALVYRAASLGAAEYFGLRGRGAIAPGYLADIVVLDDAESVAIAAVYRRGRPVDDALLSSCVSRVAPELEKKARSSVHLAPLGPERFAIRGSAPVIGLVDRELLTTDEGRASDYGDGLCKVAVVERHRGTGHIGLAWLKGYGVRNGAVAVSVAHDSHNLIAAGSSDEELAAAVNALIAMQGGMCAVSGGQVLASVPLPVAGLMSDMDARSTQAAVDAVKARAWELGANRGIDPLMTLSFVSLPVIPRLKLTTLGVVDVERFRLLD